MQKPAVTRIRKILFEVWDPLQVSGNPNLTDEYDTFIGDILLKIEAQCSAEALEDHLARLENDLGVTGASEPRRKAALQLLGEQ